MNVLVKRCELACEVGRGGRILIFLFINLELKGVNNKPFAKFLISKLAM